MEDCFAMHVLVCPANFNIHHDQHSNRNPHLSEREGGIWKGAQHPTGYITIAVSFHRPLRQARRLPKFSLPESPELAFPKCPGFSLPQCPWFPLTECRHHALILVGVCGQHATALRVRPVSKGVAGPSLLWENGAQWLGWPKPEMSVQPIRLCSPLLLLCWYERSNLGWQSNEQHR